MRILVVEDNPKLAAALARGLEELDHRVEVVHEGFEAEERALSESFDLIVLDRMLPDRDGVDVCRTLRRAEVRTPILMLTAVADTKHKVEGLDAGADDYLAKPFEFEELLARVRALLRRGLASESTVLTYADLELDLVRREARRAGTTIHLSGKEFALLECLLRGAERVLPRRTILERVWDIQYEPESNVLDVYVSALRRKVDRGFEFPLIHTVVGTGYRLGMPSPDGGMGGLGGRRR